MVELELEELGEEILRNSDGEEEEEEAGKERRRVLTETESNKNHCPSLEEADADYERLCQERKAQVTNAPPPLILHLWGIEARMAFVPLFMIKHRNIFSEMP